MIYPDIELNTWLQKFDLEVTEKLCPKCKQVFLTNIPILIKGYAGLETPEHDCGSQYKAAIFTPTSSEKINFWKKVI